MRTSSRASRLRAFTLIELLIVIAIIAILAAIALPNFLEAQTRAKVSRAMADMRSMSTAIEAYYVDNNAYPRGRAAGTEVTTNYVPLSRRVVPLTTPVAYMTSVPPDAFPATRGSEGLEAWQIDTYDYFDADSDMDEDKTRPEYPQGEKNSTRFCVWRLSSAGPDLYQSFGMERQSSGAPLEHGVEYDPTNGTLSIGDILRLGAKYQ